jgi:hypothetical protein
MSAYAEMMHAIEGQRKAVLVHSNDDFTLNVRVTYRKLVGKMVATMYGPAMSYERRTEEVQEPSAVILQKLLTVQDGVRDTLKIRQGEVLESAKVVALILGFESPVFEYERTQPKKPARK